jgi:hypothetical protein
VQTKDSNHIPTKAKTPAMVVVVRNISNYRSHSPQKTNASSIEDSEDDDDEDDNDDDINA